MRRIINKIKKLFLGLRPHQTGWAHPADIVKDVRRTMGHTPGGIYAGISFIPGDPNKPWDEDEERGECPACGGTLRDLTQPSDLIQDGENIVYYKTVCRDCNYTDDTGRKMTKVEVRGSRRVYCPVVGAVTFNRTGHSCDFIDPDYNEPVTRIENWCDECPLPH